MKRIGTTTDATFEPQPLIPPPLEAEDLRFLIHQVIACIRKSQTASIAAESVTKKSCKSSKSCQNFRHGKTTADSGDRPDGLSGRGQNHAPKSYRSKGILQIKGQPKRIVFQGVQMMFDAAPDRFWNPGEKRMSQLVFIGQELDEVTLRSGFESCIAP